MDRDKSRRKEEGRGLLYTLATLKEQIDPSVFETLKILESMEPPPKEPKVYVSSEGTADANA